MTKWTSEDLRDAFADWQYSATWPYARHEVAARNLAFGLACVACLVMARRVGYFEAPGQEGISGERRLRQAGLWVDR